MIDLSNPLGQVFGRMPPETQEAMKAHGGPWEVYSDGGWKDTPVLIWFPSHAYRVKPAPIRETVTLYGGREGSEAAWGFYEGDAAVIQSHRITLTLIDGKLQPTATVEEL